MDKFINMHPESLGDLDADLMCPAWSKSDLLGGLVLFTVLSFVAGVVAARWLICTI